MYTITGVLDPEATSACGDDNSTTLFSIDFSAENDEAAITKAEELVQELAATKLRDLPNPNLEISLTVNRMIRRFHYLPPQEAQPAREAIPAQPARLV